MALLPVKALNNKGAFISSQPPHLAAAVVHFVIKELPRPATKATC